MISRRLFLGGAAAVPIAAVLPALPDSTFGQPSLVEAVPAGSVNAAMRGVMADMHVLLTNQTDASLNGIYRLSRETA